MNQQEKEQAIWAQIADDLRSVGSVGEYGFETYISKLRLLRDTGTKLVQLYTANGKVTSASVDVGYATLDLTALPKGRSAYSPYR